jgi:hypothetical protein
LEQFGATFRQCWAHDFARKKKKNSFCFLRITISFFSAKTFLLLLPIAQALFSFVPHKGMHQKQRMSLAWYLHQLAPTS